MSIFVCHLQEILGDNEDSKSSEFLPSKWNDKSKPYEIRYVHDQKVYELNGWVMADDTILLNLLVSFTVGVLRKQQSSKK